jgi:hypothetical protein
MGQGFLCAHLLFIVLPRVAPPPPRIDLSCMQILFQYVRFEVFTAVTMNNGVI